MANEKMTWAELRKAVAQMAGTTEQEAGDFLNAMIDGIIAGLQEDQQVKIKGIGTFALKEMAARKSVNIATGEEFVIEGYNKLTFNAEATLKENIEKRIETPKTEELVQELKTDPIKKLGEQADEIVDILADLGQSPLSQPQEEEAKVEEEEKEVKEVKEKEKKEKKTTKKATKKTPKKVTDTGVENTATAPTEEPKEEVTTEENDTPADNTPKEPAKKANNVLWIIVVLVLALAFNYRNSIKECISGLIGQEQQELVDLEEVKRPKVDTTAAVVDSIIVADSARALADTTQLDSMMVEEEIEWEDEEYIGEEGEYNEEYYYEEDGYGEYIEEELPNANSATSQNLSLADQPRIYSKFLGIERVTQNSRLTWIATKYYGHRDFWVYVYEANRSVIKDPSYIRAGQHLRIPEMDEKYLDLENPEVRQLLDSLAKAYLKK